MEDRKVMNHNSEILPEPDEGWWAAVLADEAEILLEKSDNTTKQITQVTESNVTNWDYVKGIFQKDEVLILDVYGFNRGGLLVKGDGIQGFVPISHLMDVPSESTEELKQIVLSKYEGKPLHLKIIECEPSSERIVLSERAARAGEGKRRELFDSLRPGVNAIGMVTNVTEFGIFVDLGGVEGLVHVSELSWGRVEKPADYFVVGQQVEVVILQVNESTSRIALSIKRLHSNPWDILMEKYKCGDIVQAEITSIMRFGVFAKLDEGVEGLIHISSIPCCHSSNDLSKNFSTGQMVMAKILHINAERRRLGLGLVSEE